MSHDADQNREDAAAEGIDRILSPDAAHERRLAARRRFLTGGIATIPVVATLKGRSALAATNCSISGQQSGNLSGVQVTCQGLTPGYYKNTPDGWPAGPVAGPCNPFVQAPPTSGCVAGIAPPIHTGMDYSVPTAQELSWAVTDKKLTQAQVNCYNSWTKGTLWSSIFGTGLLSPNYDSSLTLMQALNGNPPRAAYSGNSGTVAAQSAPGSIGSGTPSTLPHCVAAYLNALKFPGHFGYAPADVVILVRARLPIDAATFTSQLSTYINFQ
jgi:hypothetical protein